MSAPLAEALRGTFGYHPVPTDVGAVLERGGFDQLLVFGPSLSDVVDHVSEVRIVAVPSVELPVGVYWFAGLEPSAVLLVQRGANAASSMVAPAEEVTEGHPLDAALGWLEQQWDDAAAVPAPLFAVGDEVVVSGTGRDGIVRPGRRFSAGRWTYEVFTSDQKMRRDEDTLMARPSNDDPSAWVGDSE